MAEDRFANVFTAEVTQSAANAVNFAELQFGIQLRDRIAIVIDELLFYPAQALLQEMTGAQDQLIFAITVSDQLTGLTDLADRRIIYMTTISRQDQGTAASSWFHRVPIKEVFTPPMIILPTRVYFALQSTGLASAGTAYLRMHFRTVKISADQQLVEILEAFTLST